MKRILVLAMLLSFAFAAAAQAATEVKMTGDARIHGNWFNKPNYTGWDPTGTQTSDPFTIWQRFRLRSDFIANENLKFRFAIRANNTPWGNNYTTVDNPAVSIQVYQAYLQFKWPNTDVEFTIGLQPLTIAQSSFFAGSSLILDTWVAGAIVNIPVVKDTFSVVGGFVRMLDSNRDFDPTTRQVPDEFDGYYLSLPITLDGFSATPWALLGVAGRNANYAGTGAGAAGFYNASLAQNLFSAGTFALAPANFRNSQNLFWWVGGAFEVTALDPFKFYADVIYGEGNASDRGKNRRGGFFFDVAAEYTGFDMLTPQVAFWWSTGEDASLGNGSERLPTIAGAWGSSTSFLFDSDQAFVGTYLGVNPVGSWGFTFSLNKVSFVTDLSHRLTFAYLHGNNSSAGLRRANAILGSGNFFQMGRDLTVNEYVIGINFDNTYNIYENLQAICTLGWSHGEFERSVWGRRMTNKAKDGDVFMASVGLQYKF
ncbi:MAG: outer membrane homotrimeric porin [Thermodesulfobacteriota bacterium]